MVAGMMAAVGFALFFLGLFLTSHGVRMTEQPMLYTGMPWWRGALLGLAVTTVVQSSSMVSVLLVSAVSAKKIGLREAFGILLGVNVGTTATAWLALLGQLPGVVGIVLPAALCLLLAWGWKAPQAALGLGAVFFGMHLMTLGASGLLRGSDALPLEVLEKPLSGFLWGSGITALLQSSSATIGVLQAAAGSASMNMALAAPIAAGCNVGTCVTALFAALPMGEKGKQLAMLHLLFNLGAACLLGIAWYLGLGATLAQIPAAGIPVAAFHTLFNLFPALLVIGIEAASRWAGCALTQNRV